MIHHRLFDNAHPLLAGAYLSSALPWDHLTNALWAIGGSVASWAVVRFISWSAGKLFPKK